MASTIIGSPRLSRQPPDVGTVVEPARSIQQHRPLPRALGRQRRSPARDPDRVGRAARVTGATQDPLVTK
jgi:hypothetical protein